MEEDVDLCKEADSQVEEIEVDMNNDTDNKQINQCTEITLTDEQYNMLENKGWVLLETLDKIYVLDSLGLHDITTNQDLIQQLKTASQGTADLETCPRSLKIDQEPIHENIASTEHHNTSSQQNTVLIIKNEDVKTPDNSGIAFIDSAAEADSDTKEILLGENKIVTKESSEELTGKAPDITKSSKQEIILKIMTKFKDIPDKIVLGKTANGKKLVAKVLRTDNGDVKNSTKAFHVQIPTKNVLKLAEELQSNHSELHDWQFESLVQQALNSAAEVKSSPEQLAAAEDLVTQLLQVPAFQKAVSDRYLFITKVVKNKSDDSFSENLVSSVTGRVTAVGEKRFIHLPHLLQWITGSEYSKLLVGKGAVTDKKSAGIESTQGMREDYILHVHATEIVSGDSTERVSFTLNKRRLPLSLPRDMKKRQVNKIYACSSCAAIFDSEMELTVHQENQCTDTDDTLTIDTAYVGQNNDVKLNPYCILKTAHGTHYACLHCSLKFNKLSNCRRHVKTHLNPKKRNPLENDNQKLEVDKLCDMEPTYKCKMCSSAYYHASTLSKHIVSTHIKVS